MSPPQPTFHVLFLCTGNSARSILAEYLMGKIAPHRFHAVSAGSDPKPTPHPLAIKTLKDQYLIDVTGARSKLWREFEGVAFDFVITLCDNAKETCPIWPGQPIVAHWPSPDPAEFTGDDAAKAKAFWQVAQQIQRRLELFTSLPFEKLDALRLAAATREIGTRETIPFHPPNHS